MDKVYALPNLEASWKRVKRNKGAAGVDGQKAMALWRRSFARLHRLPLQVHSECQIVKATGTKR